MLIMGFVHMRVPCDTRCSRISVVKPSSKKLAQIGLFDSLNCSGQLVLIFLALGYEKLARESWTKKNYGKNTQEALNVGFLWGYQGLINNIIKKISLNSKPKFKIILTGGYAKLFKRYIKSKTTIDQNVTIKGIAKVLKEII